MAQQVEVRLTNGESATFDATGWDESPVPGGLDIYDGESQVATFAPGQWSFVSSVVIENHVGEKLSVGDLTVDVNDVGLRALIEGYVRARGDQARVR